MDTLTKREIELVALGASLGSNCIPCVAFHVGEARKCGISDQQIRSAIEVAEQVRKMPAELVRNAALAQLEDAPGDGIEPKTGCGC
jgi:4-carboxymuconolactone decarboxylase